ncbi:MAG: carbonic anhydrase [Bdellovibrionales bacterium]|nr:carbonic anhydrase [Bdellovibrionales bacterium]
MKKLINGIMDFRRGLTPERQETFARLALGQSPDALFIGCSDSRVAVNVFASTDPGDLFVVRNVGNMVPPCGVDGQSTADESEAAAIEFALQNLAVKHIIICGHSECGAMQALAGGRDKVKTKNLRAWLRHGEKGLGDLTRLPGFAAGLAPHNRLSQFNVLRQMHHLKTYPIVRARIEAGTLAIHGWWFDLAKAEVYAWEEDHNGFVVVDDAEGKKILARLGHTP